MDRGVIRWLAVALALAALPAGARDLRVMSFNVRYPNPDDGANRWEARAPILIDTIRAADPDWYESSEYVLYANRLRDGGTRKPVT